MPRPRKRPAPPARAVATTSELPLGLLGRDRSGRLNEVRELSWAQFDGVVQALSREISGSYNPDVVLGIAHGGLFVGGALASALGRPFHPIRISRRSRDATAGRRPKMTGKLPREVKGARVLLVDDVAASGDTLLLARALGRKAGALQVRTATLLCRDQGFVPDWTVLVMETPLLFPWDYGPVTEDVRFDLVPAPVTPGRPRRTRA
jgi:hypoxanthine phosphoribosyltransferase